MAERFKDKLKDHIKDIGSAMELVEREERKRIEAERQHELWESAEDADVEEDKVKETKKIDAVLKKELGTKKGGESAEEKQRAAAEEAARDAANKAKQAKAWSTTKKIGRGATIAGAGLMTSLAVKPVKKVDAVPPGDAPKSIVALFWFSVLIHIVLWVLSKYGFASFYLSIAFYVVLIIMAIFAFNDAGLAGSSYLGAFIVLSVITVVVPLFLGWVPDITITGPVTLRNLFAFLLVWLPIWPFYLGVVQFKIPLARFYVGAFLFFSIVIFVLNAGFSLSPSNLLAIGARPSDILSDSNIFLNYLVSQTKETIKKAGARIGNPRDWLNKTENYLGLNYYTSTIDDTEQEPVGFYITNVRAEDRYFYEGSPATVVADVRGKSFVDELFVVPSCYIDKKGDGVATPPSFRILGEEQSAFYCRFTDLTKGSYSAKVSATFDFETWAYLEYNFVDVEIKRSYDAKGENINSALKIPTSTKSVSTPGPIRLGMASQDLMQPILIDKTYNTRRPAIGASLINVWTDGQIGEVYEFVLSIPNDFELQDCSRGAPTAQANENITGYTDYIFTRDNLGDPRSTFEQFRCFLYLREPGTFFASGIESAKRTFIGRVKYRYKLEKSVSLIVKP